MLGPPGIGFPLERDAGLLRQYHGLLGEGRGILAAHWYIRRSGNAWWLSLFHKLMLYQQFPLIALQPLPPIPTARSMDGLSLPVGLTPVA